MHTREDNIEIDLKGIGYIMDLSQYKAHGLTVLNTVINICFHQGRKYQGGWMNAVSTTKHHTARR